MQTSPFSESVDFGATGVFRGQVKFSNPKLETCSWPLFEIRSPKPGARLCVSAGVHPNEVSSIEAAIRLQDLLQASILRGSVSIIPVVNLPAMHEYTQYNCPIDGKNINFTFPGNPSGTFSEALCDAIQSKWCLGADCYVDMHGGELRENVSKFSMYQRTASGEGDELRQRLACSFDADIVVGLPPSLMENYGRPPTGFARQNRNAIMSEAGANGLLDEESIAFHVGGVMNIARELGIIDALAPVFRRSRILCDDYLWVSSPVDGLFYANAEPAQVVKKGQKLGEVRDIFGRARAAVSAPATGYLLWRITHPIVKENMPLLAVGVPRK